MPLIFALLTVCLILLGAIAGFFYAYWCSVMVGFDAASPQTAIAAMQAINATVRNAYFAPAFFGPLIVLPLTAIMLLRARIAAAAWAVAIAAVLYGLGAFLPTALYNVPLNNGLARELAAAANAAEIWARYAQAWNLGNTLRMAMSFAALIAVGFAMGAAGRARPA